MVRFQRDTGELDYAWLVVLCLLCPPLASGEGARKILTLDEIIVTASRREEKLFNVPFFGDVIRREEIQNRRQSRSVPEIFFEEPSILVQKTSHGQGSPFLRGFTGFRTLLLIDGIRLNNSVFRDGPNQYWNTVDPFIIERLEVVKGPSSVLYGSDAIGGTVGIFTQRRERYEPGFHTNARLLYRYSIAESSNTGRMEVSGNLDDRFGFFVGSSLKDFGNLEAGGDIGRQPRTGYDQDDRDLKLEYFLEPDTRVVFAHQHSRIDDAWRTHKTVYGTRWHGTTRGNELSRILDQQRDLTYLQFYSENRGGFLDAIRLSLSYHIQEERRFRKKADARFDKQGFKVRTVGFWSQFETLSLIGDLTYGIEFYRDRVDTYLKKYNADGTLSSIEIQGPVADDATYDLLGIYLQDEFSLSQKLDLTAGARFTYAKVDADKVKDPTTGNRISVSDSWNNIVGSLRFTYHISQTANLYFGVSEGFRAPNLSDLTRFDTARTNEIETPSPGLEPEEFRSLELGFKLNSERCQAQLAYYYTRINDMIVRYPTGRVIGGDNEVQKANVGDGYIQGVELEGNYRLSPQWSLFGGFAWQTGKVDTYPTSAQKKERRYISRLLPATAVVGLRWQHPSGRYWAEALVRMADKQDHLSPRDKADTQRIPPGGTPGYAVFGLRAGLVLRENLNLTVALENIADKEYRIHGSGLNEAGRNLLITLDWRF